MPELCPWLRTASPGGVHAGRAMSGFVTGEQGLGHAVLLVPNRDGAERFFTGVLGFRLSDTIVE